MVLSNNELISKLRNIAGIRRRGLRLLSIGIVTLLNLFVFASMNRTFAAQQEPFAQALADRAAADGFELSGIEKIDGGEMVSISPDHSVSSLRKLLTGYNYILELEPSVGADKATRKPVRLRILGPSIDNAGDIAASAPESAFTNKSDTTAMPVADPASTEVSSHPVVQLLQTIAASAMPIKTPTNNVAVQLPVSSSAPSSAGNNAVDMAALTRTASANVNALVTSLKAACPVGANC